MPLRIVSYKDATTTTELLQFDDDTPISSWRSLLNHYDYPLQSIYNIGYHSINPNLFSLNDGIFAISTTISRITRNEAFAACPFHDKDSTVYTAVRRFSLQLLPFSPFPTK